jgi:hypothetical protein
MNADKRRYENSKMNAERVFFFTQLARLASWRLTGSAQFLFHPIRENPR